MTLSLTSTLTLPSPRAALAAKSSPDGTATFSNHALPAADIGSIFRETASAWGLTRRERDILRLTLLGLTNRQMASELSLTRKTIEAHVTSLLKKAKARNRNEVVARLVLRQS